jgi:hypothetical protein
VRLIGAAIGIAGARGAAPRRQKQTKSARTLARAELGALPVLPASGDEDTGLIIVLAYVADVLAFMLGAAPLESKRGVQLARGALASRAQEKGCPSRWARRSLLGGSRNGLPPWRECARDLLLFGPKRGPDALDD